MTKKILIPLTNHATLGDTDQANGTFAIELTHPLHVFQAQGYDYDLVSIHGGEAPLYGTDMEDDEVNAAILADSAFQAKVQNTLTLSDININDYDAVFYPGGFGLLSDLSKNEDMAKLTAQHYEDGGIVGAVCHGPAGLLPIELSNGDKLIGDKSVTGFTREEEVDYGTINDIPFLLEEALSRTANQYSKRQPWQVHVVADDRVITGQNPASAHGVAEAIVARLKQG